MGTATPDVTAGRVLPLDGIRAIAVLAVLGYHGDALSAGYLGVDMFFVLSGFLITSLLVREYRRSGRISLRGFWVRRALRLLPALYVYLAAGLVLVVLLKPASDALDQLGETASVVLCMGNWWALLWPNTLGAWNGHLWSLSLEQQFYVLWPLLLPVLMARSRRLLRWGLVGSVLALWAYRAVLLGAGVSAARIYMGLDTRADALLLGAVVAVLVADGVLAAVPTRVWGLVAGCAWVALGSLALIGPHLSDLATWMDWIGYPIAGTAAAGLVAATLGAPSGLSTRILGSRPLVWLGEISYAFYLWHFPITVITVPALTHHVGKAPAVVVAIVLTAVVAEASRRFVEAPVARRRARVIAWTLRPRPAPGAQELAPG